MRHEDIALALVVAFFTVIFVSRVLVQRRRTGDTGLRPRSPFGSVAFFAHASWVLVTCGYVGAVVLGWLHVLAPVIEPGPRWPGAAAGAGAIALCFAAQHSMGASWRIGLREGERTELVVRGPFSVVRNPIYASVLVFLCALAWLVPNVVMLASLVGAVASIEAVVRLVEEPHLRAVHGDAYAGYCRRVGRLIPFIGRER